MNWQCRLYGHDWRHPGDHEVVLTRENGPSYPFLCARCDDARLLDATTYGWHPDEGDRPSHDRTVESDRR